ncbi:MAG: Sua5/YciO/YrdC/YwlC family protein, partial [Muribaculaceae bacterium]|nr:Sua5/YciO/YrdC/YwlC family protein [Muribaculaceae bacterium]
LVRELGHPLLTTSIEFSDEDYAREPSLISEAYHEKVDIMLEGPDGRDIPSTIVDLTITPYEIIREGAGRTDTL